MQKLESLKLRCSKILDRQLQSIFELSFVRSLNVVTQKMLRESESVLISMKSKL